MIINVKRYKVLKEILTVKNSRWLKPGEEFEATPSSSRIRALLEHGYIEEIPEKPKTVDDLKVGDRCWRITLSALTGFDVEDLEFGIRESLMVETGSIFLTREKGEKELARRKAKVILERDTKGFKPDWKDYRQTKVYVLYNYMAQDFSIYTHREESGSHIYFATQEDASASIKVHEKEWKIWLGVEE